MLQYSIDLNRNLLVLIFNVYTFLLLSAIGLEQREYKNHRNNSPSYDWFPEVKTLMHYPINT
jgi:hypothetical protein